MAVLIRRRFREYILKNTGIFERVTSKAIAG